MAEWRDLTLGQKHLTNRIYTSVFKAIAPDDPTGHLPNCGYTEAKPNCICSSTGSRVMKALIDDVATVNI